MQFLLCTRFPTYQKRYTVNGKKKIIYSNYLVPNTITYKHLILDIISNIICLL